jgi:hypothetical protein
MRTLTRKGYGRIYVQNQHDIKIVEAIIKEMNEFEFTYLPDDYITLFTQFPKTVYTGKFDELDLDLLTYKCYLKGVFIFCFDAGNNEFSVYSAEQLHGSK